MKPPVQTMMYRGFLIKLCPTQHLTQLHIFTLSTLLIISISSVEIGITEK